MSRFGSALLKLFGVFFCLQILFGVIAVFYLQAHPGYLIDKGYALLVATQDKVASDAIVVLGGFEQEERIRYGIALYRDGFGKYLVFSGCGGREWIDHQVKKAGVPTQNILNETQSYDTYDNAVFTRDKIAGLDIASILLVTSPDQSGRAKLMFRRVFKDAIQLRCTWPENTLFTLENIKNDKNGKEAKEQFVLELVKYLNYWWKYREMDGK